MVNATQTSSPGRTVPPTVPTVQNSENGEQTEAVTVNIPESPFEEICDKLLTFLDQDGTGPKETSLCTESLPDWHQAFPAVPPGWTKDFTYSSPVKLWTDQESSILSQCREEELDHLKYFDMKRNISALNDFTAETSPQFLEPQYDQRTEDLLKRRRV
jgi:hypothetical protein